MTKLPFCPDRCTEEQASPLLPERALVERKLLALEDVSVAATALAGARGDDGVQTTSLELLLDGVLNLSGGLDALGLLLGDRVGLLDVLGLLAGLDLPPAA